MLPKNNRASTKDVDLLFKQGKFIASSLLTFKFTLTSSLAHADAAPRISFIAPKSVAKLAVKRNLLRRLGYTALQKHMNQFLPGTVGVFVFKKYEDDVSAIENEIKNILGKIR